MEIAYAKVTKLVRYECSANTAAQLTWRPNDLVLRNEVIKANHGLQIICRFGFLYSLTCPQAQDMVTCTLRHASVNAVATLINVYWDYIKKCLVVCLFVADHRNT